MEHLENILQNRGILPTAIPLLVLNKLMEHQPTISHQELAEHFEGADKITLFRTLKTFLDHNLIQTVGDETGPVRYALAEFCDNTLSSEQYTHFHCSSCGRTYLLTDGERPSIFIPQHFQLDQIPMTLKGRCDQCG